MILNLEENKGGLRSLSTKYQDFKATIANKAPIDLILSCGFLTWNNKRGGIHHISKRIDYFLVMNNILSFGGVVESIILPTTSSKN